MTAVTPNQLSDSLMHRLTHMGVQQARVEVWRLLCQHEQAVREHQTEFVVDWILNNYQDHQNIASLILAIRTAGAAAALASATTNPEGKKL